MVSSWAAAISAASSFATRQVECGDEAQRQEGTDVVPDDVYRWAQAGDRLGEPTGVAVLRAGESIGSGDPEAGESLFDCPDSLWQSDLAIVVGGEGKGLRHGIRRLADGPNPGL